MKIKLLHFLTGVWYGFWLIPLNLGSKAKLLNWEPSGGERPGLNPGGGKDPGPNPGAPRNCGCLGAGGGTRANLGRSNIRQAIPDSIAIITRPPMPTAIPIIAPLDRGSGPVEDKERTNEAIQIQSSK